MKIFLYCISLTFFFKEAFYKIGPQGSSVLSIITAFQYIITQMTLIFLIKKDQFCNLIPEINIFFIFLKNLFNKYYSIFLFFTISIIIMSNPYVGYGNQVIYFTTRIIFSFLFFPIVYNLYIFIKNKFLFFFIDINESEVKNKFPGGKTCYIIFISMIYFLIIWITYLIFCKTWDLVYSENIISKILNKNLIEINPEAQERILFLSLFDIIRVIILTAFGYIFSYVFNNLIVKQILHDIIISVSMQNTIITLVQYLFVFFSFIISLYASGLQSLTTKIAFFIGFLGFAIKEPFSDFISYFIILIQRPIKVGDLIKINYEYEIIGTVRQITPRTTLLRQRNSQIIIVPNSLIVTKLICNWNYSKNAYIGTEDILLTVNFDSDVDLVKLTLQKAVESNSSILKNPAPIIRCENFTPSGYEFLVRGYILAERSVEIFDITSQ